MSDEIKWTVSGGQSKSKKAPYAPKQKIRDDASESEKGGVRIWNAWYDILVENDLMEKKK